MKQIAFFLLLVVTCAISASFPLDATPYVSGAFNDWAFYAMTETDPDSGVWEFHASGLTPGSQGQYKINDGTWSNTIPEVENSWYYADSNGDVTFTFNMNNISDGWFSSQFRLGLSVDPGTWTLVGDTIGSGWDNSSATGQTMSSLGNGIYSATYTLGAGDNWFKPVVSDTWLGIGSSRGRSVDADNYLLTLEQATDVTVYVDAYNGIMKVETVPEPASFALLGLGALLRRRRG